MPKSVLVADDSVTMRKVIGLIFAHEDFTLTVVDNGLDAIHRARELRPDVVLADCMMPGKSGYEVCEAIKGDPSTMHIPVMLLAGTFEPFDENRARAARADAHVVKPFESQAFLDKVKGMVGMPAGIPVSTGYSPVSTASVLNVPKTAAPAAPAPMGNQPRPMPGPAGMPGPTGMPMGARPPGGVPPGTVPGMRNPMGMAPGQGQPGMPMGRPPPPQGQPGMPMGRPPGQPGMMGTSPGVPNPLMQGRPGQPIMGAPMQPQMGRPPPGQPMPGQPPGGFPRPPGGAPMPGTVPPRRDPFGLGGGQPGMPPMQQTQPQYRPPPPAGQPQYRPPAPQQPPPPQHNPLSLDSDGGEAALRNALSQASREVIEKIAWEVVPQLAETIIRSELDRLIKDRESKN